MPMYPRSRFLTDIGFYAVVCLIIFLILRYSLWLFWPFLGGLALAYLFKQISRKMRIGGGAPVAVIAAVFYVFVVLLFWGIIAVMTDWLLVIAERFPKYFGEVLLPSVVSFGERAANLVSSLSPQAAGSLDGILSLLSSAGGQLVSGISSFLLSLITGIIKGFPMFLIGFVFMIVSSFTICMDYTRVTRFIMRQIPPKAQPAVLDVKNFLTRCLFKLVRAYALIMLVTAAELWIGFFFLRIEYALQLALITAALDILPLLGSGAVLMPWGIYHLVAGNPGTGTGLLLLWAIITVVRNIIEPKIVGDQLGLHPAVTLTAMFLGLKVFGVAGIFLMPVAALLIRYLTTVEGIPLYKT